MVTEFKILTQLTLFPVQGQCHKVKLLITLPYQNLKDARTDFQKHSTLEYHKTSDCMLHALLRVNQGKQKRVDICISSANQLQIGRNCVFFTSIIICGRQGIALHGYIDDSTSESPNHGNFKALLNLRIDFGDVALDEYLRICVKTSTYISKTVKMSYCIVSGK